MPRIPHAAKTLIEQVQQTNSRAKATTVGEPDGFGVRRSIRFDKTSSKRLARALSVMDDERIAGYEETKEGVVVTFSNRTVADQRHPFPLTEAEMVAENGDPETSTED